MAIYNSLEILSDVGGEEILTLSEVKEFLKVYGSKDDNLISGLIKSAMRRAENLCNLSLSNKTYSIVYSSFCDGSTVIRFPIYKVLKVIEIFEIIDCKEKKLKAINYCFDIDTQYLSIKNIGSGEKIKIIFETVFDSKSLNLYDLKSALLFHINLLYKRRLVSLDSKEIDLDERVVALYRPFRFFRL